MLLENYRPKSHLVGKSTLIEKPAWPVIDAHNHLGEAFGGGWDRKPLPELLSRLDAAGVRHYVDLDGGWGEDILLRHLDTFKSKAPERFSVFGGVNWSRWQELGDRFPDWAAGRLRTQKQYGAAGLKIWKLLGLHVRDHHGKLVDVDDARLSPIWEAAGELHLPVVIHIADPVAFFDSINETNERWEELGKHPDWAFTSPPFPPFLQIVEGLRRLVGRHPNTTFVGAHVGCYAENLAWVGQMLDQCPNYSVDISARIGELGRQPYSARKFFMRYQDRILFGSDMGPEPGEYRLYYRFLETDDEYFNYNTTEVPAQGRWHVHGIYLPDEVLRKVYRDNAARLLGLSEYGGSAD
ncbi:MAG TPA: amidohydrolase family protein [Anaerolineales bacterium]|nr:amidohydrolase family protein [Anaerolineales bacterium]